MKINRRKALGTAGAGMVVAMALGGSAQAAPAGAAADTAAGSAANTATGAATGSATAAAAANSGQDGVDYVFALSEAEPGEYDGGNLRGAHAGNFPILDGEDASVYYVHLDVGGIREPHWHPTAWELNYVITGRAKWTMLGTRGGGGYDHRTFEVGKGDLVFAPQGFLHYFENASGDEPLEVLVMFNTSAEEPDDDIGILATVNALPRDVLAASLGVPVSALDQLPTEVDEVVITRHR
ncbi:cupin domain-containing protein [Prauserella rugosa]|uniref:Oxalate decarboxylase n=1 Tax=Prauserella rugosa TaxID=43354 RepID=A0A660CEI4_9PSEU|nr:cupin domain-containing protein [Prauserella rugosa]TWH20113.1 oxalate decarboxylase [Prauserella rugosa]